MSKIRDLYIPEVFNKYFIEETTKLSNLIKSEIVIPDAQIEELARGGGRSINLPFFKNLDGDDEVLGLDKALTAATVGSEMDACTLIQRGRAWKVSDLESALTGEDVMGALISQLADYWNDREQKVLLSTLKGVFASDTMQKSIYKAVAETTEEVGGGTEEGGADSGNGEGQTRKRKAKTGENIGKINAREFIKAKNLMGDNSSKLTAVMMHSDTFAELEAQNLIQYIPNSQGVVDFPSYMGKKVIVNDQCPVDDGVYSTYLFGAGAIARAENVNVVMSEIGRNHLSGTDELVTRRAFILHPRGVKFKMDAITGLTPTNEELETGTNWERVYDNKAIRIVCFKHKL